MTTEVGKTQTWLTRVCVECRAGRGQPCKGKYGESRQQPHYKRGLKNPNIFTPNSALDSRARSKQ